jgi:hypothetical protein
MGSAGSNTTADHITVLTEAIAQLPARYRLDLLITVDGVGASHGLVDHIPCSTPHRGGGCTTHRLGAGHPGTSGHHLGAKSAWGIVLETEGQPREVDEAGVVELTALLRHGPHGDQLVNWPEDMCIVARREREPHPGAQLSLFEATDGWRYQLRAINTPRGNVQFVEARHRPIYIPQVVERSSLVRPHPRRSRCIADITARPRIGSAALE